MENPFTSTNSSRAFSFVAGDSGPWRIQRIVSVTGEPMANAGRLSIVHGGAQETPAATAWQLHGVTSNERYVTRQEKDILLGKPAELGRPAASCATLIPLRKSPAWWALTQDERREVFEAQSRHIQIGLNYLPAIARKLFHCRDLAAAQPYDFLTWFEYAAADEAHFNTLLQELRATPEWRYVDSECEIRLLRDESACQG